MLASDVSRDDLGKRKEKAFQFCRVTTGPVVVVLLLLLVRNWI